MQLKRLVQVPGSVIKKRIKSKPKDIEILKAAEKLFVEKGFDNVTTAEIAKEAGCNQALLHYYYRTKKKLFEKIWESKVYSLLSLFRKEDLARISIVESVRQFAKRQFEAMYKNQKVTEFLFHELQNHPERVAVLKKKLAPEYGSSLGEFSARLDEEYRKGNIRKTDVVNLMFTIFSLNLSCFVSKNIFKTVCDMSEKGYQEFLKKREEFILDTVTDSLRPR
ncbi:MAG: TetR/AcrR family transcriptional regulator [Bacteroidales bacterium]|jgi:AcrR family transcriptional regulator|nr:TetR/AcrR family transcriptional regulator [Bacteroidales bacterium]MCI2122076.1 TetR/AcrR family transcriptional regulator [Bacteroidales bacterium]MCI2146315.1 TetR/AcrR family transcriptional regulator [Bacteroidales bacterium]